MTMTLLHSPASPFARKVRVMLRETGRLSEVAETEVSTSPFATADEVAKANPLGKIPALILSDGQALYDSRVITRYLDSAFAAGLYPEARLWQVLVAEATGDAVMEATLAMTYEARLRPPEARSADWVEAQWAKIARTLDHLESAAALPAGLPDMGAIALACALGYIDLRHDARNWRAGRPALAAWFTDVSSRPSMTETSA